MHTGFNNPTEWSNVALNNKTKGRLKEIGKMGESFDALINRLLDEREANQRYLASIDEALNSGDGVYRP